MPLIAEEKLAGHRNPRSPSPPVRRSLSTDRGALIRSRLKPEMTEKPISKPQFPVRVSVNKSVPLAPTANHSHVQDASQQGNISEVLSSLQRANVDKFQPDNADEQLKGVLNVRQVAGRKSKNENKPKTKNPTPSKNIPKIDESSVLVSDMGTGRKVEEARKSDFSEPENEILGAPIYSNPKFKKLRQNSARSSQYLEPR